AEYGHLYWVMKEIAQAPDLALQVVVTAAHLVNEFGLTWQRIEADGFEIAARVEMLLGSDTPVGVAKSMGVGLIGFAETFARLKPDLIVVLGDRFELLSICQAAVHAGIPIAHIHGGEITEGLIDEAVRHSVSKMSHLHFTAAEPYRRRVIQMGENPERVFNVGAPGLDHLTKTPRLSREEWQEATGFRLGEVNLLVTYHPVTLESRYPGEPFSELLQALDGFPQARIIFTKANADTQGRIINRMIDDHVARQPERCGAFTSLGTKLYFSALPLMDAVVGNSSSGLIEVPFFKIPTINLGDRQKGRLKAASVIDCQESRADITRAIKKTLSADFRRTLASVTSPYGVGEAARRIVEIIQATPLKSLTEKSFYAPKEWGDGEGG
ncbi:MAG: UDP-N-acetylglucosamine 2-epimerase (hydrolyzing), partial [Magnetococcales bacterium]|nr:UDP-N-acetylglucosamine 2-epimerase (hydrolyzing) [Magnetococcales bacterium]